MNRYTTVIYGNLRKGFIFNKFIEHSVIGEMLPLFSTTSTGYNIKLLDDKESTEVRVCKDFE